METDFDSGTYDMKVTEELDAKLIEIVGRIVDANPVAALEEVDPLWLAVNLKDGDVLEDVIKEYLYLKMAKLLDIMEEPGS